MIEIYEFSLDIEDMHISECFTLKSFKENSSNCTDVDQIISNNLYGVIIGIFESMGLYAITHEDFYVGRTYDKLKDDETGKQFRDSVEKIINKLFKAKCEHIEVAYNG